MREDLKGIPVIPKKGRERIGEEDFYVDKAFRRHGNPKLCKLRTAGEQRAKE